MPITLVAGLAGSGKTSLAVHVAHLVRHMFPGGQLYADLLGATPHPLAPADVLGRFLRDLGANDSEIPEDEAERAACYRTRLAGRKILVVLDDARDVDQVRALLPGSGSCAVMITSRSRMPDLDSTRLLNLDMLNDAEALSLFTRLAGGERSSAEPDATAEVLAACDGLPLAIRLCGAKLASRDTWTVATIARRLRDETRRLEEMTSGDLSVRAAFAGALANLPAQGRGITPADAFRLLGMWNGPTISTHAAAALFGSGEEDAAAVLELLVDAHLLASWSPGRFSTHGLLRLYASERALTDLTAAERSAATARLLHWYLRTADAAATAVSPHRYTIPLVKPSNGERPALAFAGRHDAQAWYDEERANVVAATRLAAAVGSHYIAWLLPAALFWLFDSRGSWRDGTATHLIALDSARQDDHREGEAWVLNNLGVASSWTGDPQAAEYLERSLEIRRKIGDRLGQVQSTTNLARLYQQTGRGEEAVRMLYQALDVTREIGHQYGEGVVLVTLGHALLALHRPAEALSWARHACNTFSGLNNSEGIGYSMHCVGRCLLDLGRYNEAGETLARALTICRDSGNLHQQAVTLRFLGHAQARNGQARQAQNSWTCSAAIYDDLGDTDEAAQVRSEAVAVTTAG